LTTQTPDKTDAPAPTVHLKDPVLAALLAWLVPGLGHLYQGRWAKAVLFFVCIMGTFIYGLYLGSGTTVGCGRVVYAMWRPEERRWSYLGQIGVGLPAAPALVQAIRVRSGREPLGTFMAPPRLAADGVVPGGRMTLDEIHRRLGRYFELGTTYTFVAGLLNVLVIMDAWAGPVVVVPRGKKDEEDDEDDKDAGGESTKPETTS